MKLTVEKDNGETEVFQNIADLYIAYQQEDTVFVKDIQRFSTRVTVRSHSWGANVRELVKEVQQSLVELQDFLRGQRNGGSS